MSTVYLPTAIVGNGRVLCTMGASGEVMSFFFPNIDHAQHIHECMLGVYASGYGYSWTFEPSWERSQSYIDGTNILRTRLFNRYIGVEVALTDFVPPDVPALVRQVEVRRTGLRQVHMLICQYHELWIDGHRWKNCVQAFPDEKLILQWCRDTWIAIGATPFHQFQCGKSDAGAWSNAKDDLYDGSLKCQALEIGSVNFALAWELPVGEMQISIVLTMAAGRSADEAVRVTAQLRRAPFGQLLHETKKHWMKWLKDIEPPVEDDGLKAAYMRAQLVLPMLFDHSAGAPIAAPEFDPAFIASGGYGFCWLRDAANMMWLWLRQRRYKHVAQFIKWASKVQLDDGSWLQRYWLNGHLGPAWSTGNENTQWDQIASMVILACECLDNLVSFTNDEGEMQRLKRLLTAMALKGAQKLYERASKDVSQGRVPIVSMDLWETFIGSFVYTNAAVYRALCNAAELAKKCKQAKRATQWLKMAEIIKEESLRRMSLNGYLVRGLDINGRLDSTIDSSVLGAIAPFEMLPLKDEFELELAINTVEAIVRAAVVSSDGRSGVARYVGDLYAGGMVCTMSTLWVGMAMLRIAEAHLRRGELDAAKVWLNRAEEFICSGASFTTPAGIHCELFKLDGSGYWAPGHAWASAWVVRAIDELARLKRMFSTH
ncbi:MAG: hypothetical protein RMK18_11250 [Armatimonadota bacterium]|nr:hypothetical protein [Armatimonadota bacterium]MDW8026424.1 hypothetical protein [Armatimonadota bacterium]